jgi:hypothetical protein
MKVTPALASRIVPCTQGELDWFMARVGRCTASEVINALSIAKTGKNKGGSTEGRKTYMASIVAEILTGEPDMEGYATSSMNRGTNEEPRARAAYEMAYDVDVDVLGFVIHPDTDRAGSSPDGLVGADGMLEIKNPKTKNHIQYMLSGELPEEYEPQVMFSLACTEREWCDFLSYDGRMPAGLRVWCKRIYRNEPRIREINAGVMQFLEEADEIIYNLRKIIGNEPPPPVKVPEVLDPNLYLTDADIPEAWR